MSALKKRPLNPIEYPMLAQFAAGYLHEDFVLDHKTPVGAREAFIRDANAAERAAFAQELARYRSEADGVPWADVRAAFASLGGAWRPLSRAALRGLLTPTTSAGARKDRAGQGGRKS